MAELLKDWRTNSHTVIDFCLLVGLFASIVGLFCLYSRSLLVHSPRFTTPLHKLTLLINLLTNPVTQIRTRSLTFVSYTHTSAYIARHDDVTLCMMMWHCVWWCDSVWWCDTVYDDVTLCMTTWQCMMMWHYVWWCDTVYDDVTLDQGLEAQHTVISVHRETALLAQTRPHTQRLAKEKKGDRELAEMLIVQVHYSPHSEKKKSEKYSTSDFYMVCVHTHTEHTHTHTHTPHTHTHTHTHKHTSTHTQQAHTTHTHTHTRTTLSHTHTHTHTHNTHTHNMCTHNMCTYTPCVWTNGVCEHPQHTHNTRAVGKQLNTMRQKRCHHPKGVSKETYYRGKETYYRGKKELLYRQKRPTIEAKETYYRGKRDLLEGQKW